MKKTFLSLVLSVAVSMTAFAQTYVDGDATYEFKPYNYIQLQGGMGYTLGEAGFSDLLSPAAAISFGRQFTPVWGLRLSASGWESKGAWSNPSTDYKWNYAAGQADLMVNLTNLFGGWKPMRKVNVNAFVGVGGNLAAKNGEAAEVDAAVSKKHGTRENFSHLWEGKTLRPIGRAGAMVDFRCNDHWSINLEANANVINDHYNSKHADNADWYFNGLVGLKYNFGSGYKKTVREPEPEPVPVAKCGHCGKPINECEFGGNHPKCATCGKYLDECEFNGNHPAPKPQPMIRNIFFLKNSAVISNEEAVKIQEIAAYLNGHEGTKVVLTGYADKKTGNYKINQRISEKRAAAVSKFLQENCHIAADRISSDFKGDTVQPFAENDENRVCICIAE